MLFLYCFKNNDTCNRYGLIWSTVVFLFATSNVDAHSTCLNTLILFNDARINYAMCKDHGRMYVILQGNVVHEESLTAKMYSSGTVMPLFLFRCLKKEDSWSVNGLVFYTLFEGSFLLNLLHSLFGYDISWIVAYGFSQFLCILLSVGP